MQLAIIDLKGLDSVHNKVHEVDKALRFVVDAMRQRPLIPENSNSPKTALVGVEKRLHLHRDFAGFWSPDGLIAPIESRGWIPVDGHGQIVDIGSECKSITWRRLTAGCANSKALYGNSYW